MLSFLLSIKLLLTSALLLASAGALVWLYLRRRGRGILGAAKKIVSVEELIPESNYLEFNDTRLHYVQAGKGPDVVLLHGIGASIYVWRFLFPLLQIRHRVTAFDLPGFGKSCKEASRDYGLDAQAKVLAESIERLGLKKPYLVGSSMGGSIALWMAKTFPERYSKVAALAPATDSSMVPAQAKHFGLAAPLLRRALNRRTMKTLVSRVVTRQSLVTEEAITAYLQPFMDDRGSSIRAFWSAMALLGDRRLPSGLSGLTTQTLIIYGTRDLLVSRKSIDRLVRILPQATLLVHQDGGHHIMEDEPAWTARTLERFFSGNGPFAEEANSGL